MLMFVVVLFLTLNHFASFFGMFRVIRFSIYNKINHSLVFFIFIKVFYMEKVSLNVFLSLTKP